MSHYKPRSDAVWHAGRRYVPTIWGQPEGNTRHVDTWEEFQEAGGCCHFNEDQTEVVLTLPEGVKFSCRFMDKPRTQ
jgi:hypothetical protein